MAKQNICHKNQEKHKHTQFSVHGMWYFWSMSSRRVENFSDPLSSCCLRIKKLSIPHAPMLKLINST